MDSKNPAVALSIKDSRTGLGAFTSSDIHKGQIIVDWTEHPLFGEIPKILPGWRFIQIAPGVYSGPIGPEYPDAYINHSCEPNSEIRREQSKILLCALCDIPSGQEVTFDYATLYKMPWSMICNCGKPSCRGKIEGKL